MYRKRTWCHNPSLLHACKRSTQYDVQISLDDWRRIHFEISGICAKVAGSLNDTYNSEQLEFASWKLDLTDCFNQCILNRRSFLAKALATSRSLCSHSCDRNVTKTCISVAVTRKC